MSKLSPYERAQFLLRDADIRLREIKKANLSEEEIEKKSEWLELRILEIRNLLTSVHHEGDEIQDEELLRIVEEVQNDVRERIMGLEKDPWDAGYHNSHAKTKKPKD